MGLFDGHITDVDWNGDGVVNSWDDAMFSSMITMQVEDMNREDRISRITRAITSRGVSCTIGNEEFEELCRQEGLDMNDFEQSDIDEIQRRLDLW